VTNVAKGTHRWLWKGSIQGASVTPRGDGETPSFPFTDAGGIHTLYGDIEIPATSAGDFADWHDSYPGQYISVGTFELDIFRYMAPLDAAQKLHGKGNAIVRAARVLYGAGLTGDTPPTMPGGSLIATFRRNGIAGTLWQYNGVCPSGAGIVSPTATSTTGLPLGTDFGFERLIFEIEAIGSPIVAGRWRFEIDVSEV
jgi:hypothetical protein